jgi:hypothetical protein
MSNFHDQASKVDEFIRTGKFSMARKLLTNLKVSRTSPLEARVLLASLWKRIGEPFKAMKILGSMEKFGASKPSLAEKEKWLEFADCLLKVNALGAVSRILSAEVLRNQTKYHLIRSFLFIHSWDYHQALDSLKTFLKFEPPHSYSHFVARINELACLTFLREVEQALDSAEDLLPRLQAKNYDRLLGNSVEILMQLVFQDLNASHKNRLKFLIESFSKFQWEEVALMDQLQLRKWKLFQRMSDDKESAFAELLELRAIGSKKGMSELVRDIDRMILEVHPQREKRDFLFFGTPYEAFLTRFKLNGQISNKIELHLIWEKDQRSWVLWSPENSPQEMRIIFDVLNYMEKKEFSLTSKLLLALFFDFYRAPSTVELFDRVYPSDYFHPVSSLRKINQLVHRLNKELLKDKLPFQVVEKDLLYFVDKAEKYAFRFSEPPWKVLTKTDMALKAEKLKKIFPEEFTLSQALSVTQMKRRTLQALLKDLVDQQLLARSGRTSKVSYLWK